MELEPPFPQGPEIGGEAQRSDDALARDDAGIAALDLDGRLLHPLATVELGHLGIGHDAHTRSTNLLEAGRMGAELLAPMHQGDAGCDRLQHQAPVDRRISASDDDDILVDEARAVGNEVVEAAAEEVLARRQRTRREGADPSSDDHRPSVDHRARAGADAVARRYVGVAGAGDDLVLLRFLSEEVRRLVLRRLRDQSVDQLTTGDHRQPGDVVDLLLRVHRADLAAELAQRVDDCHREPARAGVVRGEQADRPRSDDEDVDRIDLGGHDGAPAAAGAASRLSAPWSARKERTLKRWSFPVAVFGRSSTKTTERGALKCASPSRHHAIRAASSAGFPSWTTTTATGLSRPFASGRPTTATSRTDSCSRSRASTSPGDTQMPPAFNMSPLRPRQEK